MDDWVIQVILISEIWLKLLGTSGKSCRDFEDQFQVALTGHFPNLW